MACRGGQLSKGAHVVFRSSVLSYQNSPEFCTQYSVSNLGLVAKVKGSTNVSAKVLHIAEKSTFLDKNPALAETSPLL